MAIANIGKKFEALAKQLGLSVVDAGFFGNALTVTYSSKLDEQRILSMLNAMNPAKIIAAKVAPDGTMIDGVRGHRFYAKF